MERKNMPNGMVSLDRRPAMPSHLLRLLALLLFMSLCGVALRAQTNDTATIRGQVLDQNKAAITHAKVVVANELTGLSREAETDAEGRYTISGLPLTGKYKVVVTSSGFASNEN